MDSAMKRYILDFGWLSHKMKKKYSKRRFRCKRHGDSCVYRGGGKGAVPPPRILQAFTIFKSYLMLSPRVPISFLTKIQPIWFCYLASHTSKHLNERRTLLYRLQLYSYFFFTTETFTSHNYFLDLCFFSSHRIQVYVEFFIFKKVCYYL
jgi:hypothetical protein